MNDSLRTDVFVRYPPETIAVACIYLSARKLKEPLPKNPAWFEVLGVEEDDIKDCCYRMICLYNRKKKTLEELEAVVEERKRERKKLDDERRAAREQNLSSSLNTPAQSSPNSRAVSPAKSQEATAGSDGGRAGSVEKGSHQNGKNGGSDKSIDMDDRSPPRSSSHKSKKHKHKRSRSRSTSFDDYRSSRDRDRSDKKRSKKGRDSRSRSRSFTPPKKRKHGHHRHHHKDKTRYRSRSRDRGGDHRRGGVASIGLHDPMPKHRDGRDRDRDRVSSYDRKSREYRR